MEIYLIGACAKNLVKFYKLVLPGNFEKVSNMDEEESAVCLKMSDLGVKLSHFLTSKISAITDQKKLKTE